MYLDNPCCNLAVSRASGSCLKRLFTHLLIVHSPRFGARIHLHQPHVIRFWASYLAHRYLAEMGTLGLTTLPETQRFVPSRLVMSLRLGTARSRGCPSRLGHCRPVCSWAGKGWSVALIRGFCQQPPGKEMPH